MEDKGVLKDTRKITELSVPIPRTKLYVNPEKKLSKQSGSITLKKYRIFFLPKERLASSKENFIDEKPDEMMR